MALQEELPREEEELRQRRAETHGDAFERLTDQLHDVRRKLYGPDLGPVPIAESIHQVIARVRAELDGYLGGG